MKVVLAPRESDPFQYRKNRLFRRKSDILQVWKNRFFRSPRRTKLRQSCSGALKKRPLLGSEKLLFRFVKTLEIVSRLFWRPYNTSPFRFGKIAFSDEKAISFRFGKIAFSGRQDARNCVTVVLAPSKPCSFRLGKIAF